MIAAPSRPHRADGRPRHAKASRGHRAGQGPEMGAPSSRCTAPPPVGARPARHDLRWPPRHPAWRISATEDHVVGTDAMPPQGRRARRGAGGGARGARALVDAAGPGQGAEMLTRFWRRSPPTDREVRIPARIRPGCALTSRCRHPAGAIRGASNLRCPVKIKSVSVALAAVTGTVALCAACAARPSAERPIRTSGDSKTPRRVRRPDRSRPSSCCTAPSRTPLLDKVTGSCRPSATRCSRRAVPLRGVASDTAAPRRRARRDPGAEGAVGHSYGGLLVSELASRTPDVTALVYAAAFIPQAGETAGQLTHSPRIADRPPRPPTRSAARTAPRSIVKPGELPGAVHGATTLRGGRLGGRQRPITAPRSTRRSRHRPGEHPEVRHRGHRRQGDRAGRRTFHGTARRRGDHRGAVPPRGAAAAPQAIVDVIHQAASATQ